MIQDTGEDQQTSELVETDDTLDEVTAEEAGDLTEVTETPEASKVNEVYQESAAEALVDESNDTADAIEKPKEETPGRWYVVHTFSGHENKVATNLRQRIESEHLENRIFDISSHSR